MPLALLRKMLWNRDMTQMSLRFPKQIALKPKKIRMIRFFLSSQLPRRLLSLSHRHQLVIQQQFSPNTTFHP
ncbi:hypothetical protein L5515_016328 [Caenorhabditis briggsae]|uniref:Uncharacterized protein n=1 Tax=Caenorhabditis briggsae TaxID=6238 RepID=A0AAE9F6A3_CAEBR|nr:hypothetical protein L5515_016328 [Caenorhabditis briggsae]